MNRFKFYNHGFGNKIIQVHWGAVKTKKLNHIIVGCAVILLLTTVSLRAQSVVVNKYFNSGTTADIVELLVIQNNLDMRGMYIKDFSSNMANDGGGKYQFSTGALWSSVPSGTLIVLRNNNSAANVTISGRVMSSDGRAIGRAQVRFNDVQGKPRTAVTNQFGYFTFE